MPAFIGIDLGTTYSAVASIDETGRPIIIHAPDGSNITPSCVSKDRSGRLDVGEQARRQWGTDPRSAAARFKRDMGTSVIYDVAGEPYTPTQLSTLVLTKLAQNAAEKIGEIGEAVVTIPANFAHEARDETMAAARAAGLAVKYIINEPTAAALYYAFKSGEEFVGNYAVYDLGGGTFDISIIRVNGQDVDVIATNGVSRLGGDDFDAALQKLVGRKFKELTGDELEEIDFSKNDAEEEKRSLSARDEVTTRVARQVVDISRSEFEAAISSYITQAEMLCEATIEEAELEAQDLNGVFLVGGSTRIPSVVESVKRVFGRDPISTANVDEVVALGAALYAAYKGDQSSLSTVQQNAIKKIKVSESTSMCFGTIAIGLNTARDEPALMNSVIIRKGAKIPCSVTESFYTASEDQQKVACKVTESSAPETDPRFVKIIWEGALNLPSGRPAGQEIQITYSYDDNQIMHCAFVDVATKSETKADLSMASSDGDNTPNIDKFLVE